MTVDYSKLSRRYVQMMIRGASTKQGVNATVYKPIVADNLYQDLYPEHSYEVRACIRILIASALYGSNQLNFISLYDKIDEEYIVISDTVLEEGEKLLVEFPDGKQLNLLVSSSDTIQQLSTIGFAYYTRTV